ncbi:uncharacterized protein E0L32_004122 [Thyridium curvatum]|uniref:DNA helicase n=1 Tax=Thyridium curvatum TaxID=1093900 RepID=A0A507B8H2_9PEZI|nr:uncharacterized protein E0L32_004122 [Thyridium curvatum]TPX16127.1 hypothetical protein E0L32_004122 [Thyridium curvatum]
MTGIASPGPTQTTPGPDEASASQNGHLDAQISSPKPLEANGIEDEAEVEPPQLLNSPEITKAAPDRVSPEPKAESDHHDDEPQTNGHAHHDESEDDGRPSKRRRVQDPTTPPKPTTPRRPKPISPPWKRIEAEGPTSFTEGGRRKSGRINTVPLEMQSSAKRITRRALHGTKGEDVKAKPAAAQPPPRGANTATAASRRPASAGKAAAAKSAPPTRTSSRRAPPPPPPPQETKYTSRTRRRSPPPPPPTTSPRAGTRRSSRQTRDHATPAQSSSRHELKEEVPTRMTPRIKLRFRSSTIPLIHPDQAKVKPKIGPSFEEYFETAGDVPVEEGGLMASEDGPRITDEVAVEEAAIMTRIEQEAEEGGILAVGKCSAFAPEPVEEPPRQWAHMDHLVKAMANFRRLLLIEQNRHRATAKKLAEACREEWRRRQPKTQEEIEEEARRLWQGRYRLVAKAMFGTWENVKAEINRRRLEEWEAEEQKRVQAALQEVVAVSQQKLAARQLHLDSEDVSTMDGFDDMTDDEDEDEDSLVASDADMDSNADSDDDEDNMSSSEDEEDAKSMLSDEGLTQEQLREKYANLPSLVKADTEGNGDDEDVAEGQTEAGTEAADDDTSDESVDMDDDMGSTDMDSDDGEEGSDGDAEDSDSESDAGQSGLLGLFFGKSELKKMNEEAPEDADMSEIPAEADVEMLDAEPAQESHPSNGAAEETQESEQKPLDETQATPAHNETTPGQVAAAEQAAEVPLTNGTAESETHTQAQAEEVREKKTEPEKSATGDEDTSTQTTLHPDTAEANVVDTAAKADVDVEMTDVIPKESTPDVPEVEVTAPASDAKQHSPETDAVTNVVSPDRSPSPRTSDTKPSEVDTTSSVELLGPPKETSRSTSPQGSGPKTEIPFLLRGTLREYQHYGLDWLAGLYANNTNGILADEMGLGKTIQTIALLAHLACHHEVWGPHLVIVPTSVMLNWEMEFKKWCPGFKILTYYGNQDERKRKRQGWTNDDIWNVCITSYQMVLQDQQVFKRRKWHYMILDEAHNIKNFKSQRWQTLLGFNTHSRLLLTGTPLQNNLTELWSLLFFLTPSEDGVGGFADLQEFHEWFGKPESQILESGREQMDEEARALIAKLHQVLRPYLLRRLKADVEKQMPAKYEHVEFCRLSKRQRELYDGFLSRTDTRATLASGNYLSIINCLMQLRKVCNHPDLFVDRPIMTSFRMAKSVAAEYTYTELEVQRRLKPDPMSLVSLDFLNLIPTRHEDVSDITATAIFQLSSDRTLMDLREAQRARAQQANVEHDPRTVRSNMVYLESGARWRRFEELQHAVYLNALRRQQRPIYGKRLLDFLTIGLNQRPYKPRPRVPKKVMEWFENDSFLLRNMIPTLERRADSMEMMITKFACATPAVVTRDMHELILGRKGVEAFQDDDLKLAAPVKYVPFMDKKRLADPWHEARMRLSIQFPDKRLLQYDCGKLQALDRLLRKLQAGGHRALIFTQMTKVLDILEQFLNIHGHKYLRLDGATKVEQRQILTDRFNHDPRILCFILSTRSGGLGINLTGADTVIFYDQDWNPAMDKQCQDRCHRIGQTRDVHIYRLVSEHTIEANILRKASQKQMLDDVVIQEGEFTTDYFNKLSVRDVIGDEDVAGDAGLLGESDAAANAAMDRVLGGVETSDARTAGRALEQAEDKEDVTAARAAEKEFTQDDADFAEKATPGATGSGVSSVVGQGTPREGSAAPGRSGLGLFAESAADAAGDNGGVHAAEAEEPEYNAWGGRVRTIDDYMLGVMAEQLRGTPLELPKDKKKGKSKRKRDHRKR